MWCSMKMSKMEYTCIYAGFSSDTKTVHVSG